MITVSIRTGDKLDAFSLFAILWAFDSLVYWRDGVIDVLSPWGIAGLIEDGDQFIAVVSHGLLNLHLVGEQGTVISPVGCETEVFLDWFGAGAEALITLRRPQQYHGAYANQFDGLVPPHRTYEYSEAPLWLPSCNDLSPKP